MERAKESTYSKQDLERVNWYGFKGLFKRLLGFWPFNRAILWIAGIFPSLRVPLRRFPVNLAEVTCRSHQSGEFVMLSPMTCDVAREIHWGDGWRHSPQDRAAIQMFECLARQADLVLDIGAYSGYFSLLAARASPAAKVIAFEIVPDNYLLLMRNIMRNDLVSRIEARLQGVGDAATDMRIPLHLNSSVLPSSISTRYRFGTGVRIPFVSLDSLRADQNARVLIKMDVEGDEGQVMRHAGCFLAAHKPDMLCEILTRSGTEEYVMQCLRPLGYHFYTIRDTGIEHVASLQPDKRFKDWFFSTEPPDVFLQRVAP